MGKMGTCVVPLYRSFKPCHVKPGEHSRCRCPKAIRSQWFSISGIRDTWAEGHIWPQSAAFLYSLHNLRAYGCFWKHPQFLIISRILGHVFLAFVWFCQVHHRCCFATVSIHQHCCVQNNAMATVAVTFVAECSCTEHGRETIGGSLLSGGKFEQQTYPPIKHIWPEHLPFAVITLVSDFPIQMQFYRGFPSEPCLIIGRDMGYLPAKMERVGGILIQ